MRPRTLLRTTTALAAAALLAACSTAGSQEPTSGEGASSPGGSAPAATAVDTVRYVVPGSPSNAATDPHGFLPGESDLMVMALTYDPLTVPGADGETEPRLATAWEPDETLTRWTVTLRDDAVFADGSPVRAADALFSLRRMGEKAAENFGRLAMFDLESSTVVDDTTLELATTEPYAEVGKALEGATFVVPEGSDDFSTPVPGSGPYVPAGGDAQASLFERNDDWWGPTPPTRVLEVRAVPDAQARADALLSGQADVATAVPATVVLQNEDNPDVQVVRRPGATLYPLVMRTDTPPFDDVRVREAVKLALDREQLVETVFLGYGEVGQDVLTPQDPNSPQDLQPRVRDLDASRALLAEAGLADGVDVTLFSTTAYPGMDTAATVIAQQLAEVGIRVEVELQPADTYFVDVYASEPFYLSYLGGIPFLDVVRVALTSGSPTNETAWEDVSWHEGLAAALAEPDAEERRSQLADLQVQLRDEGGYAVWALSDRLDLAAPGVSGMPEGIGFSALFVDQVRLDG